MMVTDIAVSLTVTLICLAMIAVVPAHARRVAQRVVVKHRPTVTRNVPEELIRTENRDRKA